MSHTSGSAPGGICDHPSHLGVWGGAWLVWWQLFPHLQPHVVIFQHCWLQVLLLLFGAPPKATTSKKKNFLAWGWTPDIWETQSGTYSGHQELISVFVLKIELLPRVFMFNYMSFLLFLVQWGLKAHHDDFAERPKLPLLTFLKVESIHQGAKIIIIIIKLSWNYETYTRKKLKDYVLKPQDIEYYSL